MQLSRSSIQSCYQICWYFHPCFFKNGGWNLLWRSFQSFFSHAQNKEMHKEVDTFASRASRIAVCFLRGTTQSVQLQRVLLLPYYLEGRAFNVVITEVPIFLRSHRIGYSRYKILVVRDFSKGLNLLSLMAGMPSFREWQALHYTFLKTLGPVQHACITLACVEKLPK